MTKFIFSILFFIVMTIPAFSQSTFKAQQLTFERVRAAYQETWSSLQKELTADQITGKFNLYIAAYKAEGRLEFWLRPKGKKQYQLFKVYTFCQHSGTLGPKLKEGDRQTPEGFYYLNSFNPKSNFHLSLRVNYPNQLDVMRSGKEKPGSDIYIHGNCVTVGCIPITDQKIKEAYVLAVEAKNGGQEKIPVHLFPFKMNNANLSKYLAEFPQYKAFWTNLQQGYLWFDKNKTPPAVSILNNSYQFK